MLSPFSSSYLSLFVKVFPSLVEFGLTYFLVKVHPHIFSSDIRFGKYFFFSSSGSTTLIVRAERRSIVGRER